MYYIVVFQPSKCRNTHFQPQIWSIWPIFPNDSESLPKVCYIKQKNSEILSKLRNSESAGGSDCMTHSPTIFIEGICWVIKMIGILNYDWRPWKFPGTWKFPGSWTFSSPWNFPGGLEIFRSWKFPGPLENSRILDISRPPGKFQGGPYLRSDTLWGGVWES